LPEDDLWQYTSVGHLDGIVGNVDLNVVTNPNEFNFFNKQTVVTPVADLSPQFCTKQVILQTLRCDGPTDIRVAPNHAAGYVRDTQKGEVFHVFDKVIDSSGHCWNNLGGANWADEASGVFYWLDNPNLKQQPTAQYYVIQLGDALSRIAAKFGTSIGQLQAWNSIANPNRIFAGQKIRVK
jgi:lysozyme